MTTYKRARKIKKTVDALPQAVFLDILLPVQEVRRSRTHASHETSGQSTSESDPRKCYLGAGSFLHPRHRGRPAPGAVWHRGYVRRRTVHRGQRSVRHHKRWDDHDPAHVPGHGPLLWEQHADCPVLRGGLYRGAGAGQRNHSDLEPCCRFAALPGAGSSGKPHHALAPTSRFCRGGDLFPHLRPGPGLYLWL